MRAVKLVLLILGGLLIAPTLARAQGSIAGTVKDTTGAVLPGVTVEVASPVLIEKTRSVVSDATGQYRVTDLRPGTYSVTFTLTGFNSVKRDGVDLVGTGVVQVSADLKVGSVAETITVTGETQLVDVQSSTKQAVLEREIVDALPTGRDQFQLAMLVPGMAIGSRQQDVGGTAPGGNANLMIHGARGDQQRMTQNGLSTSTLAAMGSTQGSVPNLVATQEVTVDVAGAGAEQAEGGVMLNVVPREGGNTFRGSGFGAFGNRAMQGDNFDSKLAGQGLVLHTGHLVRNVYDINPGVGGPIVKDTFWFFATIRYNVADNYAAGKTYFNANPLASTWRPALNQGTPDAQNWWKDGQARLTYQATPRNKISMTYDQQARCNCFGGSTTASPESVVTQAYPLQRVIQADWTVPINARLLLEVVALSRIEGIYPQVAYPGLQPNPELASLTDTNGPTGSITYRAPAPPGNIGRSVNSNWRASLAYITGTHNIKIGYNDEFGYSAGPNVVRAWPFRYTISGTSLVTAANPAGNFIPNSLALSGVSVNDLSQTNLNHDMGIYAQDKWVHKRLTFNYGVRYDFFEDSYPAQSAAPGLLTPNRNFAFAPGQGDHLQDITPRSGIVFDLFGDGKTAIRATANKYLEGLGGAGVGNTSPTASLVNATNRNWNDSNGDLVPQCDLTNTAANGECGADITPNFGGTQSSLNSTDPSVRQGWQHRGYNWEFSLGVNRQILPRVSVDFGYYRRIYGNNYVTKNLSYTAADFNTYSVNVPTTTTLNGTTLPGSGGTVGGFYALNPSATCNGPNGPQTCVLNGSLVAAQNYLTFADTYGSWKDHWNGFDVNVNSRLPWLTLQGGTSTGKSVGDFCALAAVVPEMLSAVNYFGPNGPSAGGGNTAPGAISNTAITSINMCHVEQPWQTSFKGLAIYTVPKINVQVSGTFQNTPGVPIIGTVAALASSTSLGRLYAAGTATTSVSTNLTVPGTLYGNRLDQLDLRFSKILKYGGSRTSVNVDLYNALNANTVLTQSNVFAVTAASTPYSAWQTPTAILQARLLKLSFNIDF